MYLTFVYDILYFCGIYVVSGKIKRHVRKKPEKYLEGGGYSEGPRHCMVDSFVFLVE
jgi:hypothetical protein